MALFGAKAVHELAEDSEQRMMMLIKRTCQRPEDLIKAASANIKRTDHEGREIRVLRIQQGKTGKAVDVFLAGELKKLVDEHLGAKTVWPTFVHTRAGK